MWQCEEKTLTFLVTPLRISVMLPKGICLVLHELHESRELKKKKKKLDQQLISYLPPKHNNFASHCKLLLVSYRTLFFL